MGILLLAVMIATWAVAGAGKRVASDARAGVGAARVRTAQRVAKVRADKSASRVKRGTATAAVGAVKFTAATGRGMRYVGRSAYEGGKQGAAEGRKRHAERTELREARPLSDADDPTEYRRVRDRVLFDRAERAGRGVPERKLARIARRDAAEDERRAAEGADTNEPEQASDDDERVEPIPAAESPDAAARWSPPIPREIHTYPRADQLGAIADDIDNASTNGGTTMTAPTTGNGFRASGEATTISGARAAWASFEGYAVEMFDTAGQAEQEAKARMAGAAQMLDVAAAAETDAKQQMAAAQTLATSLADSDMGDPQAVADAETQQEQAQQLANTAAELRAEAEGIQASAARQAELAAQLRSAAETSQAHCSTALSGMNERNARREAFFQG